jgi:aryl-alcohol dehydrogenase-like predicted oxidoreductase
MSGIYGKTSDDESIATIHEAIDRGINVIDTGDFYGSGHKWKKLKITTATEVDLSSLAQRMRDEVVASNGVVLSPGLIGAWSSKS